MLSPPLSDWKATPTTSPARLKAGPPAQQKCFRKLLLCHLYASFLHAGCSAADVELADTKLIGCEMQTARHTIVDLSRMLHLSCRR